MNNQTSTKPGIKQISGELEQLVADYDQEFTCNDLEQVASLLSNMADYVLFNVDSAGMTPITEVHTMTVRSLLSQAHQTMLLAHYEQMRG